MGIYGAGNIGQALAAYGSPMLAATLGYVWGFQTFAIVLAIWLADLRLSAWRGIGQLLPIRSAGIPQRFSAQAGV